MLLNTWALSKDLFANSFPVECVIACSIYEVGRGYVLHHFALHFLIKLYIFYNLFQ